VFRKMFDRLRKILEKMRVKIAIMGDAAYDARENFNIVKENGHRPLIRWCVDSIFSSMKRSFGEKLASRKIDYAVREVLIMISLFNIFHSL